MKILRIILIAVLVAGTACVPSGATRRKKSAKIETVAGRTIPSYAISIDANYDPRLDNLITGYKMLPVIIKNMSLRNIIMDDKTDKWVIVSEKGKRYKAINSLRLKDHVLWRELPEKLRTLIDYPEIVPINYSVTFDLMLPQRADLEYFREIRYYNAAWKQEFILEKEY